MEFIGLILIIGVVICIRLMAGSMDDDRIDKYILERGGQVVEKHWSPFGTGWLGEKDSRIYEVTYKDAQGNLHKATCKTSYFSGVYFTEDRIVKYAEKR